MLKSEEEALYTKRKSSFKQHAGGGSKINGDKAKSHQGGGSSRPRRAPKYHGNCGQSQNNKRFEGKCYNCGKKGQMANDYWFKSSQRVMSPAQRRKLKMIGTL